MVEGRYAVVESDGLENVPSEDSGELKKGGRDDTKQGRIFDILWVGAV